jgi:hypothetical protein
MVLQTTLLGYNDRHGPFLLIPQFSYPKKEESMPIHRQQKLTTADSTDSSGEQPAPGLPDQQTFRQYLRELARDAIRVVVVDVMREELAGGSHQRGTRAVFLARSTYLLISDGH